MVTITFKVHRVLDGPTEDEDGLHWLNCRVEGDKETNPKNVMFDEEIPFPTFDEAYNFKNHFLRSIDPLIVEFDYIDRVDN